MNLNHGKANLNLGKFRDSVTLLCFVVFFFAVLSFEHSQEVNRTFAIHDEKKAKLERRRNAIVELELETANLRSEQDRLRRDENEVTHSFDSCNLAFVFVFIFSTILIFSSFFKYFLS